MAITDPYYSLTDLKRRMSINGDQEDAVLSGILIAVSRQIDAMTNQFFYQTAADTLRYVSPEYPDLLAIGPFTALTEIAVDRYADRTWSDLIVPDAVDFDPLGADLQGRPFYEVRPVTFAPYWPVAPWTRNGVRVKGTFGWPEVPAPIAEATAIQTQRLFQRRTAPLGVTGGGEVEQAIGIRNVDPDVGRLIAGYRLLTT